MRIRLLTGLAIGIACMLAPRESAAWVKWETQSNAHHYYLAWPYATNTNDWVPEAGYAIQRAKVLGIGWDNDPLGGRGMALASADSPNVATPLLYTINRAGQVFYRSGPWAAGSWTSMPLNACGTGSTIQFDFTDARPILTVMWDNWGNQVPWVIDASGRVRFWRTSFTPNCWAAVDLIPGTFPMTGIGVFVQYGGPSNGQRRIWATRGVSLYLFDGAHWQLIDTGTGSIVGGGPWATGADGLSLWRFDMDSGSWALDPNWTPGGGHPAIKRLTSSPIPGPGFEPTWLDPFGKVWRW